MAKLGNCTIIVDKITGEKLKTDPNFLNEYLKKVDKTQLPVGVDTSSEMEITVIEAPGPENGSTPAITSSGIQFPGIQQSKGSEWKPKAIRLLIETRIKMESEFQKPQLKMKLWDRISKVMEEHGHYISGSECDSKWRNLMGTYRKNFARMKQLGASSIRWEYFVQIYEGLGSPNNHSIPDSEEPFVHCDIQTPSPSENDDSEDSEYLVSPPVNVQLTTPGTTTNRKRKREESSSSEEVHLPEWFQMEMRRRDAEEKKRDEERRRREEAEARRWEEHKEIQQKKIDAMNNLIDVLKNYLEK